MKSIKTFEEFINENKINERRIPFKGTKTNQLYRIIKDVENATIFANNKNYTIDAESMRNDLQNSVVIAMDDDGEEFDVNVKDIEFIEIN